MGLGEAIENAIRKLVDYCHRKDVRCKNCPFVSEDNKCDLNMAILEDLVHFTDTEIIPTKEDVLVHTKDGNMCGKEIIPGNRKDVVI